MTDHTLDENSLKECDNAYWAAADHFHELRLLSYSDASIETLIPPRGKDILLFFDLDSEVHNGGLCQYFGNLTDPLGVVSDDVQRLLIVLEEMGAMQMATLMKKAAALWSSTAELYRECLHDNDEHSCNALFDRISETLYEYDDQFYIIYDATCDQLSGYILHHLDDFCL